MEKNNKQLLIRDICARLPYGVYIKFKQYNEPLCLSVKDRLSIYNGGELINNLQYLYLRPMSSMTEEEKIELSKLTNDKFKFYLYTNKPEIVCYEKYNLLESLPIFDWLNAHHFDFRNLIGRGLAIDCTGLNIY